MTNKNISALTAATTPLAGTETLPIVQSGAAVVASRYFLNITAAQALLAQIGAATTIAAVRAIPVS